MSAMTTEGATLLAAICAAQRAHLLRLALGPEYPRSLCDYHEFDDLHLFYERDSPTEFIETPDDDLVIEAARNR